MTLSKKDIKLLLILGGILVFVLSYFVIFKAISEKKNNLQTQIAQLEPRVKELESYYDNLNAYKVATHENNAIIDKLMPRFPNDVRAEDKIMYSVNLEKEVGLDVHNVSFADPVEVLEFKGVKYDGNDVNNYTNLNLKAYCSSMAISCTLGYQQLKKAIDYIYATPNYTTLNSVNVSYDSTTGKLTGGMNIDKYFIKGVDDTYKETYIPSMPMGTNNIFNTVGE
jgi:hypothetical protein